MSIPIEVAAAQRILSEPLRFGDPSQIKATQVLSEWRETRCLYCGGTGRYPVPLEKDRFDHCCPCEGTGKVWVRA